MSGNTYIERIHEETRAGDLPTTTRGVYLPSVKGILCRGWILESTCESSHQILNQNDFDRRKIQHRVGLVEHPYELLLPPSNNHKVVAGLKMCLHWSANFCGLVTERAYWHWLDPTLMQVAALHTDSVPVDLNVLGRDVSCLSPSLRIWPTRLPRLFSIHNWDRWNEQETYYSKTVHRIRSLGAKEYELTPNHSTYNHSLSQGLPVLVRSERDTIIGDKFSRMEHVVTPNFNLPYVYVRLQVHYPINRRNSPKLRTAQRASTPRSTEDD